ncbi:MAG: DNA polymerase III subunit gamma/tau [Leptolyngbya sp. SIO4C1]|nr:DNA polymerase III subunit gamma/tau [Leptolyngbya sp. SIO4C1]
MDYEPLHHKYRPQTFAQLVGQAAIATTLANALRQNRIAPAYLFCGPRGTGKTSSARILAKSLNCLQASSPTPEPCGRCQVCREIAEGAALDIVEIDAASNTGVDNIRELIERAQFAPVQCRYKLYVLDEVHMLSTAAFNALLKTLEEPPERVVFVLATTDPQRVLPTIISRCQRFDFRRIPLADMVQHLTLIAEKEAIAIAPDAVQLVAQISQGGLRDAESLLDQLGLLEGEITVERVWDLVGAVPERDLLALVRAIAADDSSQLLERARHLMDRGREPLIVLQSLVGFYRDLLIAKTAPHRQDLVAVTPPTWADMGRLAEALSIPLLLTSQQHLRAAEVQIKNTTQPRLWLEITLMGLLPTALGAAEQLGETSAIAHPANSGSPSPAPAPPKSAPPAASPPKQEPESAAPPADRPAASAPAPVAASKSIEDIWLQVLAKLSSRATRMLMRQQGKLLALDGAEARVGFKSDRLYKLAQDRVPNLEAAFAAVFGHKLRVALEVIAADPAEAVPAAVPTAMMPVPTEADPAPAAETASPAVDAPEETLTMAIDSEFERSVKSFAQFFNGQIVSLEDSTEGAADTAPKSSQSGPDVPF